MLARDRCVMLAKELALDDGMSRLTHAQTLKLLKASVDDLENSLNAVRLGGFGVEFGMDSMPSSPAVDRYKAIMYSVCMMSE